MAVRINIDAMGVVTSIVNTFNSKLGMLSSDVLKDCNKFCKEDTGALIASSYIHSDLNAGKLVWQTPYAARQYYEIQTAHTDKNPQASWKWCDVAKAAYAGRWQRIAQRLMEGGNMNG